METLKNTYNDLIKKTRTQKSIILWVSLLSVIAVISDSGFKGVTTLLSFIFGEISPKNFFRFFPHVFTIYILWAWYNHLQKVHYRNLWWKRHTKDSTNQSNPEADYVDLVLLDIAPPVGVKNKRRFLGFRIIYLVCVALTPILSFFWIHTQINDGGQGTAYEDPQKSYYKVTTLNPDTNDQKIAYHKEDMFIREHMKDWFWNYILFGAVIAVAGLGTIVYDDKSSRNILNSKLFQ
jgi:hypothetical protein